MATWIDPVVREFDGTDTTVHSVKDVVALAVENRAGYHKEDVRSMVNTALKNACGSAKEVHELNEQSINEHQEIIDFGLSDLSDDRAAHILDEIHNLQEQSTKDYNGEREDIGDALVIAKNNGIDIDTGTWEMLSSVDDDEYLSEYTDINISNAMFEHDLDVAENIAPSKPANVFNFNKKPISPEGVAKAREEKKKARENRYGLTDPQTLADNRLLDKAPERNPRLIADVAAEALERRGLSEPNNSMEME